MNLSLHLHPRKSLSTALAVAALALVIAIMVPSRPLDAHPGTASAAFDWSVPDRFTLAGMIGVSLPVTESDASMRVLNPEGTYGGVAPAGWPADFNACSSQGFIVRYLWKVNGVLAQDVTGCGPTRLQFPREGVHLVELTVVDTFGGQTSTAQNVNIQDWLIFGLGDSYASGEGNPMVAADFAGFSALDAARIAAQAAADDYQNALADMAAAEARVDAAKHDLDVARADYHALLAASLAFAQATADLAAKQLAATNATAAVASATAAVTAAAAKVVFECAQWWDPAGCTAAKNAYNKAKQAEAAAIAKRNTAVAQRNAAAQLLAQLTLLVPTEGYDYVLGVASAQINVLSARVDQVTADFNAAVAFVSAALGEKDAALTALQQEAEGLATWQDTSVYNINGASLRYSPCHRSQLSGQALAAVKIEQDDPKTSVTFVHLACTGAKVWSGILGDQDTVSPRPQGVGDREPQLTVAARFSGSREVDAIVTSIGGNDIGFAKVLEECILTEPCFLTDRAVLTDAQINEICNTYGAPYPSASQVTTMLCREFLTRSRQEPGNKASQVGAKLTELNDSYTQINTRIQSNWPGLPADRMFLTEYPMVSRDQNDNICGYNNDPANNLPGISTFEYQWAETMVGRKLNEVIRAQGPALGWTPVAGIENAFRPHGYCAQQSYLINIGQSLGTQAGPMGIAHPTLDGHGAYKTAIAAALQQKFYPGGVARVDGRQ